MLFDLQSRNRRNVVRVIYLGLALLMGGGLILFGIGTGGGGGLFDIFRGDTQSTSAQVSTAEKRANREVRLHPSDPQAWADLTRARYQTAGLGENYDTATNSFTEAGREKLRTAATAWKRYLVLEPRHPDPTLAKLMAIAYSEAGIADPAEAATAMEIVTEDTPSASSYATLAQYAYMANELRKGDLASGKAVELAPDAQRRLLRSRLDGLRKQLLRQRAQLARGQGTAAPSG